MQEQREQPAILPLRFARHNGQAWAGVEREAALLGRWGRAGLERVLGAVSRLRPRY